MVGGEGGSGARLWSELKKTYREEWGAGYYACASIPAVPRCPSRECFSLNKHAHLFGDNTKREARLPHSRRGMKRIVVC
jgi:hypothetical protein